MFHNQHSDPCHSSCPVKCCPVCSNPTGLRETLSRPQLSLNNRIEQPSRPVASFRESGGSPRVCHPFYRTSPPLSKFQPKSGSEWGAGAEPGTGHRPACAPGRGGVRSRREPTGGSRECDHLAGSDQSHLCCINELVNDDSAAEQVGQYCVPQARNLGESAP